jgi:DNA (cytosine-5)-methyltransferase 1
MATGAARHSIVTAFFEQANGGYYKGDGRSAYDAILTICQSTPTSGWSTPTW